MSTTADRVRRSILLAVPAAVASGFWGCGGGSSQEEFGRNARTLAPAERPPATVTRLTDLSAGVVVFDSGRSFRVNAVRTDGGWRLFGAIMRTTAALQYFEFIEREHEYLFADARLHPVFAIEPVSGTYIRVVDSADGKLLRAYAGDDTYLGGVGIVMLGGRWFAGALGATSTLDRATWTSVADITDAANAELARLCRSSSDLGTVIRQVAWSDADIAVVATVAAAIVWAARSASDPLRLLSASVGALIRAVLGSACGAPPAPAGVTLSAAPFWLPGAMDYAIDFVDRNDCGDALGAVRVTGRSDLANSVPGFVRIDPVLFAFPGTTTVVSTTNEDDGVTTRQGVVTATIDGALTAQGSYYWVTTVHPDKGCTGNFQATGQITFLYWDYRRGNTRYIKVFGA